MTIFSSPETGLFVHAYVTPISFFVLCACTISLLCLFKEYRSAQVYVVSLVATVVLVWFLKILFAVPRPDGALVHETSYAFPSGHAAMSFFTATIAIWLMREHIPMRRGFTHTFGAFFVAIALVVSASRISIGVHTWAQVIAGGVLGVVVPLVVIAYDVHDSVVAYARKIKKTKAL